MAGLVVPVAVDPSGRAGPTRGQARGRGWRYSSKGLVVPADVSELVVEQRILEAYAGAGPRAVVTGWAALRLLGGGFFDGLARDGVTPLPVPIAANGGRIDPRPGVVLTHDRIPEDEVVLVHDIRCAIAERAVFDEIRRVPSWRDQVVAVDMAFGGELTSLRRMRRYRWARYWYRDVRRLDRVLPLTSEHARSRPEVDFRLVWVQDVGWADPLVNHEVRDLDGGFVGIPDLLDVRRGVVGEFAGAGHRSAAQHESDLERADRFHRVGLQIAEVVRPDLADVPRVRLRMVQAAERASLLTPGWKLGAPPESLDIRLARRSRRDTDSG